MEGGRTVRAFVALEIPEAVKNDLAVRRQQLRSDLPKARWTRPEGWHLTLKFFGEVDRRTLGDFAGEVAPRLAATGEITVQFGSSGFFPSPARPRVAWIGGSAVGAAAVVTAVEAVAVGHGFDRETRPWALHLTLARLKARWPITAVDHFMAWGDLLDLPAFTCREAVLFESDLQPGGAVYTALERFPLE
jgi:2'-5' RNA ligase